MSLNSHGLSCCLTHPFGPAFSSHIDHPLSWVITQVKVIKSSLGLLPLPGLEPGLAAKATTFHVSYVCQFHHRGKKVAPRAEKKTARGLDFFVDNGGGLGYIANVWKVFNPSMRLFVKLYTM